MSKRKEKPCDREPAPRGRLAPNWTGLRTNLESGPARKARFDPFTESRLGDVVSCKDAAGAFDMGRVIEIKEDDGDGHLVPKMLKVRLEDGRELWFRSNDCAVHRLRVKWL